jgi:3-oxoacyl-[acyl-carrier-protein] synthase-3
VSAADLPIALDGVFLNAAGAYLPGEPIDNDAIDRFIAPLNHKSARIKSRVLRDNGIDTRHYAIDENGNSLFSCAELAARAIRDCLNGAQVTLEDVGLLCTGSSGGDVGMPGFASMVHGELAAQPMEISSHQGVCGAGVQALKHAAQALALGEHRNALVVASEFPSRLFKRSRFAPVGYDTDFDAHFLRWMLSDGAGACLLGREPHGPTPSLRLKWVHTRSFGGDYPVCMQVGNADSHAPKSYLDYDSLAEAEADGAFLLRQDIRLLPNLFEVGIHEYARLAHAGMFDPDAVDHFLCHYSSEKFSGVVEQLMRNADLAIPRNRWFSNLHRRGNTGAASIFIMLSDFLRELRPSPGEQVLCFVPESGRFSLGFMLFEVVEPMAHTRSADASQIQSLSAASDATPDDLVQVMPPHSANATQAAPVATLLRELAGIWHDYRSRAWRTRLIRRINSGTLTREDYLRWMACWIPQVREGSLWMREAAANLVAPYESLQLLVEAHANDEQFDYQILFDDYRAAGGGVASIDHLVRNAGGEALNAYMHRMASESNPMGLLGGIYIIEGTGQRIIPHLLPRLRRCLKLPQRVFRFLQYHGENDIEHLARWMSAVEIVLGIDSDGDAAESIVTTARDTANLYLMQLEQSV